MASRYQGHLQTEEYREFKRYLKAEYVECHETGCHNRATLGDHIPPISTFANPAEWAGILLPHCKPCSNKQGAMCRWYRYTPKSSREW